MRFLASFWRETRIRICVLELQKRCSHQNGVSACWFLKKKIVNLWEFPHAGFLKTFVKWGVLEFPHAGFLKKFVKWGSACWFLKKNCQKISYPMEVSYMVKRSLNWFIQINRRFNDDDIIAFLAGANIQVFYKKIYTY